MHRTHKCPFWSIKKCTYVRELEVHMFQQHGTCPNLSNPVLRTFKIILVWRRNSFMSNYSSANRWYPDWTMFVTGSCVFLSFCISPPHHHWRTLFESFLEDVRTHQFRTQTCVPNNGIWTTLTWYAEINKGKK